MCFANAVKNEREYRALLSPKYEEIELKREQIVRLSYEIQQLKLETGMIDPEDKLFLSSINLTQGWHLWHEISMHSSEINDPFVFCSGCEMKRAADGTGGVDPDVEMAMHRVKQFA
jgi:hypothetical protein